MPIYRKLAVAGATAVAIVGVGTAALATTGSSGSTNGSGTTASSSTAKHPGRAAVRRALLRRAVHGSVVTHGKNGYVAHSGIRGTAASVSATSITVKATDGFTQTFTVAKTTHVRVRTDGQGAKGSISDVKSGDTVAVLGKEPESSHANPTATIVLDVKK